MLKFHTPEEVAEIMRVSTKTVYRMINQGTLVAVHVGHQYRISEEELQMYLQNNQTAASRNQGRRVLFQ